ncbi:cobalt-precorrin-6A reductase [Microvirga flavescens]|uniref:cobalt-precorrin-6A reductase n=1 Tax=Microvirga flavescens TaxID=2249811 RepID=UPI000DD7FF9F|nr:cobalt-precorrin-6A reductase [Microvirga flavescens]
MRILILGGTTEAFALAGRLAGFTEFHPLLSFAGRTGNPRQVSIPTRIGGFGGIHGLERFLADDGVEAVIDATHPFAARISRNAALACVQAQIPLLALRRPPWIRQQGDHWIDVESMTSAAEALGTAPRRVFLTIGRQELHHFEAAKQHIYLVRTVEPIGEALASSNVIAIRDRGPFDEEAERSLMEREGIDILVSKNSGGSATYPKIAAAQALGLPVVMVARPDKPADVPTVTLPEAALEWLRQLHERTP